MKKKLLALIVLVFLVVFIGSYFGNSIFDPVVSSQNTIQVINGTAKLSPTDDTFVNSFWPDETNNGPTLEVRSDRYLHELIERVYLKFDLTGIDSSRISSAAVYLFCYRGFPSTPIRVSAHQTSDYYKGTTAPWRETSLTWNNAPDVGDLITITEVNGTAPGNWYSWNDANMTNYVRTECAKDGIVSIVIKLTVEDCPLSCTRSRAFFSKESPQSLPYLEITLGPTIESSESSGVRKDFFNLDEDVYANGTGYPPSTMPDLYIVADVATWVDGMTIPTPVASTKVSSDSAGKVAPTLVWNKPLTAGQYDIVVDVNGNGKYDVGIDALDNNDVQVTAGFFVIPEYQLGSILALAGCLAAFGAFRISKRTSVSLH